MVVVKKLKVESIKCKECKYAVILGDTVLCLNRLKTYTAKIPHFTHLENECIVGSKGEPYTDVSAYYKALEIYIELSNILKDLVDIQNRLRKAIVNNVPLGKYTIKDKTVVIKEYSKKVLDTERVKDILQKNGILEEFLVEKNIKYVKILDRKGRR